MLESAPGNIANGCLKRESPHSLPMGGTGRALILLRTRTGRLADPRPAHPTRMAQAAHLRLLGGHLSLLRGRWSLLTLALRLGR